MLTILTLAIALYTLHVIRKGDTSIKLASITALLGFSALVLASGVVPATIFLIAGLVPLWAVRALNSKQSIVWQAPNGMTFAFVAA